MAEPVSVGRNCCVMASLLLRPLSVATLRAESTGALGMTVLSVNWRVTTVALPAVSVAVARTCLVPSAPSRLRAPLSSGTLQRPAASATVCTVSTTVLPDSSSTRRARLASVRPFSEMPAASSVALTTSFWATALMPMDGPWVSISRDSVGLTGLTLPATSVATALRLWVPSLRAAPSVRVHSPALLATAVPSTVVPERRLTVAPASAVPVKVGWLLDVRLSLLLSPVSGLKLLMRGAYGALLSTVRLRLLPVALVLPATSSSWAVRVVLPAGSACAGLRFTLPAVTMSAVSTTLASWVPAASRRSSSPATAFVPASEMLKPGRAWRVMLSLSLPPVSSAVIRSGVTVPGATLSITRFSTGESGLNVVPLRTARATRV